jgi:DNA-binding IclR family transcriptional regulator
MASKTQPYEGTQSVMRAFAILQTFSDERPEWNLTELAEEVELNRTTTYRLLTALESVGMVTRDEETQAYRLGSEAIVLGGRAMRANFVRHIGRKALEQLSAKTGETATLDILNGSDTLMLDEVKGRYVMGMMSSVGTRYPAHASSTGKVLLAGLSKQEVDDRLPDPLPQLTPHTITDRALLHEQLKTAQGNSYAIARDELELGYSDVAAPIHNHDGELIAALTIGGASTRMTPEKQEEIIPMLREAASRLSHQLGHRP